MTEWMTEDLETLAALFHEIYQSEARRQGDVRHAETYADLPEHIKEFDRVLARYVLDREERMRAVVEAARRWRSHQSHCNVVLSRNHPDAKCSCGVNDFRAALDALEGKGRSMLKPHAPMPARNRTHALVALEKSHDPLPG